MLGWYRQVRRFVDPLINFFRALPPIALIPLVIVYFGIGEVAKVVILFYASFFAGVIVMYEGIAQISPIYVRVARTLGAADDEIFLRVIVPLAVPHMLTALRVALGVAWATLVASELIAARQGLGALIQDAASFFQLDIIYVGIICIGFIALVMDVAPARGLAPAGRAGRTGSRHDRGRRPHRLRAACRCASARCNVVEDVSFTRAQRRVRVADRPVRLRQDDDDEHRRRIRRADRGPRSRSTASRSRDPARARRDLPGVRRLPVADGRAEHRVRAEAAREPRPEASSARASATRYMRADGPGRFRQRLSQDACPAACASAWRSRAPMR